MIFVAAVLFKVSAWKAGLIVAAYVALESVDQRIAKNIKSKAIDSHIEYETAGWKPDSDDSEVEYKGAMERPKLSETSRQIILSAAQLLKTI